MVKFLLYTCILFIVSVVVYDIYCTVQLSEHMMMLEENPMAAYLLREKQHTIAYYYAGPHRIKSEMSVTVVDISKLILFKVVGLLLAQLIMLHIVSNNKLAPFIILPITVGAIALLLKLTL